MCDNTVFWQFLRQENIAVWEINVDYIHRNPDKAVYQTTTVLKQQLRLLDLNPRLSEGGI